MRIPEDKLIDAKACIASRALDAENEQTKLMAAKTYDLQQRHQRLSIPLFRLDQAPPFGERRQARPCPGSPHEPFVSSQGTIHNAGVLYTCSPLAACHETAWKSSEQHTSYTQGKAAAYRQEIHVF